MERGGGRGGDRAIPTSRTEIVSFVLRDVVKTGKKKKNKDTGKEEEEFKEVIVQPWKDVKDLHGYEWIRDKPDSPTILTIKTWKVESATYIATEEKVPVFIEGVEAPYEFYNKAVFQSNKDGKIYDVAERLAKKRRVKKGDVVSLEILGCCSIMNIKKVDNNKLEDQGGIGKIEEEEEENE